MPGEIATAYVQVVPTTEGIKGKLSETFDGEGDSAGKSFGNKFASTAMKVVGALGLGKVITQSITAGADVQQSFGGLETMFKDSYDQIAQYASEAWKTVGISANDYAEQVTSFSAALLSSLDGDTSKAAEAANTAMMDMGDNANKFGTSIESIQNAYQGFAKQNYTMLDNLKLGYGGTKSEMERLLQDASALSGVEYDISNLNDVYEAIHVIQQDLGVTGTTALEASQTISGSMGAVKAAFTNVIAAMAVGKQEGMEALDLTEALDGLTTGIADLASNIVPTIVSIFEALPGALLDIVIKVVPTIVKAIPSIIQGLINGLNNAWPKLGNFIKELFTSVVSMIKEVNWLQLGKDILNGIVSGIKSVGSALKNMLLDLAKQALNGVKNFFGIHSPSKVMADQVGKYIPLGMAVGIEANTDKVRDAMNDMSAMTLQTAESRLVNNPLMAEAGNVATGNYMGGMTVNVYAAEGQSAKEIAEEVEEIIMRRFTNERQVFA